MKTYIFPLNYDYSNKFLGIFEYKILTPFCILGFILILLLSKTDFSIMTKINIFILGFIPIFFIFNIKIFNESLISFLFTVIKHLLFSCIYINKNHLNSHEDNF